MCPKWSKSYPKLSKTGPWSVLGVILGKRGHKGAKYAAPGPSCWTNVTPKWSQNGAKSAPEINPNSSLIFESILERLWMPKVAKRALFLAPKYNFLQENQNLMKIGENAPRLSETYEFEDPGPSK